MTTLQRRATLSCRGLDNRIYYMLAPKGQYYNYSGCGNTLNCNHPQVRQFILECLQYWVLEMHVDGFRFDLASIMTRAPSLWHDSHEETQKTPPTNGALKTGLDGAEEDLSPGNANSQTVIGMPAARKKGIIIVFDSPCSAREAGKICIEH